MFQSLSDPFYVSVHCADLSHNARYIMLKSDYNINHLVLIHYEAEIYKRSSEAGGGESCIVDSNAFVTS